MILFLKMIKNSPKNTNLGLSKFFLLVDLATFVMRGFIFALIHIIYIEETLVLLENVLENSLKILLKSLYQVITKTTNKN